jgi:peptidyl-tRNA hydrolase, PTH1 family
LFPIHYSLFKSMHLIVGLGNPGKQYENTRHNFGFRVLDLLGNGEKWENKYDCQLIKTDDVILTKPQLFMNLSGKPVSQVLKYYPAAQLVIIHDDLDLPLGSMKIMKNSSSAGHKGVQSVIDELGSKDFIRIRLGIDNPETRGQINSEDFVLQKFTAAEEPLIKEVLEKAIAAVELLETEGLEAVQSRFNG